MVVLMLIGMIVVSIYALIPACTIRSCPYQQVRENPENTRLTPTDVCEPSVLSRSGSSYSPR